MSLPSLQSLIEKSYSKEQADSFATSMITNHAVSTLKNCCSQILAHFPPSPFNCAYISAILVTSARKEGIEAYLVAGSLDLHGRRIFDYESNIEVSDSVNNWDGHCWAVFSGMIGDASLFHTAYSNESPKWLRDLIVRTFGFNRGAILASDKEMEQQGLAYTARYVFNDNRIDGLLNASDMIIRKHYNFDREVSIQ